MEEKPNWKTGNEKFSKSVENFNSRIDQGEHRILKLEDQVEEFQHSDNKKT